MSTRAAPVAALAPPVVSPWYPWRKAGKKETNDWRTHIPTTPRTVVNATGGRERSSTTVPDPRPGAGRRGRSDGHASERERTSGGRNTDQEAGPPM